MYMGLMMLGNLKYTSRTTSAWAKCLWGGGGKLKSHKSQGSCQIPAELIKGGGRKIPYEIHKHISIWNKEELTEGCKE